MTPEEKLALLTKDFLERDGDHFVRIRKDGRLGWEDTLPVDSAYSAVIVNPRNDEDLVKTAYRLASQMIVAMDAPFKVSVRIDATRSCTDSQSVFVASRVLDDETLPVGRRLDVFLGLAIHEGSHLLYTDFSALPEADNPVVHHLQNILEDERIERELGERKPGLANFLKAVKRYHFARYEQSMEGKDDQVRLSPFARLYNAILSIVRYPSSLDPDDGARFADALIEIRDLLVPYPDSTRACVDKAREIYEIMKSRLSEEREDGPGEDSGTDNGASGGEGSGRSDASGCIKQDTSADAQCNGSDGKQGREDKTVPGADSAAHGEDGSGDGDSTAGEVDNGGSGQVSDSEAETLFRRIEDALGELSADPSAPGVNPLQGDDMARAAAAGGALLAKECEGVLERGSRKGTVVIPPDEDPIAYGDSLRRIRRFIPAVAQALRCNSTEYAYTVTGMRSGLLDTNKLGEARQGVQTVYLRKGEVRSDRVNVALVIDESGSMDGLRERLARDTAVLVNEAVGKIPNVGLYIYGYTSTGGRTIVRNFREGAPSGRGFCLGSVGAFGGTPTAQAILEAAARIRRCSRDRALMFIVSDGCAEGGARAVRQASDEVRRDGFTPVGISIASALPESELKCMYDSYIVMDEIGSLASSLGKIVKKAVLKAAGRTAR